MNIIRYILALIFFASGAAKLAGLEFEMVAFERWGYGLEFMYFTGAVEVLKEAEPIAFFQNRPPL